MFVWVALAVLLGTAAASPLQVGGAKCSWGPSYWCANIPQASQCGAVKHCIKAVWEKETVPHDDDEVCEICKEMVGEARDTASRPCGRRRPCLMTMMRYVRSVRRWWERRATLSSPTRPRRSCARCSKARDTLLSNETQEELR